MTVLECVAPTARRQVDDAPAKQSDEATEVLCAPTVHLQPVPGLSGTSARDPRLRVRGESVSRAHALGGVVGALRRQAARDPRLRVRGESVSRAHAPGAVVGALRRQAARGSSLSGPSGVPAELPALREPASSEAPGAVVDALRRQAARHRELSVGGPNGSDLVIRRIHPGEAAPRRKRRGASRPPHVGVPPGHRQLLAGKGWNDDEIDTLVAKDWPMTDLVTLANGGWSGEDAVGLALLDRPRSELLVLATMQLNGQLPPARTLAAVEKFSTVQLLQVINSDTNNGSFRNWDQVLHLAEIDDTSENLTTLGASADLSTNPWLEDQLHELNQLDHAGEKKTVEGEENLNFTCWQWAIRGFKKADIPANLLPAYFGFRANEDGRALSHRLAAARALMVCEEPDIEAGREYLNNNEAKLTKTVKKWKRSKDNEAAQRAIMEMLLTEAGFEVLKAGTQARWYICMHEAKKNVSWEHWWIKSRRGGVIETFPPTLAGGGLTLNFPKEHVNGGNPELEYVHEVPVRDLLPSQKAIIKRELGRVELPYTDDLP